ncbi:electron transfer flavoprotein subunit alpha/FixB family protein [Corynebacterium sp. 153RC1]|uniref:electron transfer flavoprotein subunit alpha/FixB family protein n=1 Tax=unclassified Corynebacterium TaxID=2624378 RepID=UPI00211CDD83|nr:MULTISPECIES: electron transfer flavoprotein subunit alpha/FixB family protein [unclassified Corynebacterium]MCQ9369934.1 electron transfer flavoprotein subunit alpha/FixB family protein [Corynebacterium sp. 35RC1]MCQ9352053.1 electron transfer flavoprotein subunit alpha/FixB family protein [Corynebacterium sp. 209RC1]MCQ9353802.1 electron transfer flavoprotein subunit alpha/FixB family protein [Corynebacterium sp. 1222RC1]MCQ9356214.1 electron transfer flavoprotein subunit alpha/FixB family
MTNAYVLVEHREGALLPATAELLTAARVLGSVTAVVVGAPGVAEPLREELASLGAAVIYGAEAADYAERVVLPEVDALHALAAQTPAPIVVAAGAHGNEIAGRLAARLASGVLTDVVEILADRSAKHSIFGDAYEVTAAVGGTSPIYTLRPGAVAAQPAPAAGAYVNFALPAASAKDVKVTKFAPAVQGSRPDLTQAKVVIAGGRGVESPENFSTLVEPLADALGGAVGATRDAVDLGYYAPQYQIGQTGVTVSPDLYIGLGISGAIQHTSGMQTAKKIVVVNNDEDAPFFQIADLGVVGDIHEITPLLIEEINKRK